MGCNSSDLARLNCLSDASLPQGYPGKRPDSYSQMGAVPSELLTVRERQDRKTAVASATLIGSLSKVDRGSIGLETRSVYGAAILLPQLARTARWPKYLTFAVFRAYMFLGVNIFLQGWLLYMIAKEEQVMDLYAGQMYLCDFGAVVADCPGAPGCMGPGGTSMTAPRMYDFVTWSTRVFVRDSLVQMFPEQKEEIMQKVDPGEYGVESHWCRWLACFIFMITVMHELLLILHMIRLLWLVPTKDEPWIMLKDEAREDGPEAATAAAAAAGLQGSASPMDTFAPADEGSLSRDDSEAVKRRLETDLVSIRIAGIPFLWKIVNMVLVLAPKALLWKLTAQSGVMFLMETSGIEDIIVNSVGLAFVLNIDEMLCETLMSDSVKQLLFKVEDYPVPHQNTVEDELLEETLLDMYGTKQAWSCRNCRFRDFADFMPWKLVSAIFLTGLAIVDYYNRNCKRGPDGNWVSRDMYLPKSVVFTFMQAFFPNFAPIPTEEEPYWHLPSGD